MEANMDETEREFTCSRCRFSVKYNYFGKKPPFAKSVVLLEEAYLMKDPFSADAGLIVLGAHCSLCREAVCASQSCSLFYARRFCVGCAGDRLDQFPSQIQQEVIKQLEQKSG